MKTFTLILFLAIFGHLTFAQKSKPNGYRPAPSLTVAGDFDGDGKTDCLMQFVTDSLNSKVDYIIELKDDEPIIFLIDKYGYKNIFTLNGKPTAMPKYIAVGLYCLINLGNINKTKGDEIALVPDLMDESRHNYCYIFSLCHGNWKELFNFSIHEDAFDYYGETQPTFHNIPEALEFKNNEWRFYDYLDMDYKTADEVGQMKKLVVPNCN